MRNALLFSLLFASIGGLSAGEPEGSIPDQTYPENQHWQIISPQMSSRQMAQPSVFNGYVILGGNAEHEVWDISDPSSPQFEAAMVSNYSDGEAESHQVTYSRATDGTYYFATISGRGIDIWNVTDTTRPVKTSELILPGINFGDVAGAIWGICWQGDYIYAGATTNGVYVIDVSDPDAPFLASVFSRNSLGGVSAGPLFALGDLLVVTTPKETAGIATVDISDPLNPKLLDSITPSVDSYIGNFYGTQANLITPYRSYDVTSDPRDITETITDITTTAEYTSFSDQFLYLGGLRGGTQGVWKYDISSLSEPSLVGRIDGRDSRWDDQFNCPVGNLIIIADDQRVDNQNVGAVIAVHDTARDTTHPTVLWTNPGDGATNQSNSGQIALSLSEWPEFKTVDASTFIVRPVGGEPIAGTWACTYTTLTFSSATPLDLLTSYEIVLPAGGIKDFVGNAIEQTFTATFTTGSGVSGFAGNDTINSVPPVTLGSPSSFSLTAPEPTRVYSWDFGDGNSASGTHVQNTYTSPGRYLVHLESRNRTNVILEAENQPLSGGVQVSTANNGFSGDGYADYPGTTGPAVKTTWTITADSPGPLNLIFRYANGSNTDRNLTLVINDSTIQSLNLAPTGGWDVWQDSSINSYFVAGQNTLELRATEGNVGPNIDHLRYTPLIVYEAEDATLGTGVRNATGNEGFTGGGYADYPGTQGEDINIVWSIEADSPKSTDIVFRYTMGSIGQRPLNLYVNNHFIERLEFTSTGAWGTWNDVMSTVSLVAGMNSIELRANAGSQGPNIDHLRMPNPNSTDAANTVSFVHIVHNPLTAAQPTTSRPLTLDGSILWAVHPDGNSVSFIDTSTLSLAGEIVVGREPQSIAKAPDGTLWVTNRESSTISVISPATQSVIDTIDLQRASRPHGLAFSPDGSYALVTLEASRQVAKLSPTNRNIISTLALDPHPRGVAINHDGSKAFVTRFISPDSGGQVYRIDPVSMTLVDVIELPLSSGTDTSQFARGLPNYLTSITLSPDNTRAIIPSKKDNIQRGTERDGLPLDHDVTVRAITSVIDLKNDSHLANARVDYDNSDRVHSATYSPLGDLAFLTFPGNHFVRAVSAYDGTEVNTLITGKTPEGAVIDPATNRLFVLNFLSRSVSVFDISAMLNGESTFTLLEEILLSNHEPLAPDVLRGKKLFYDASSATLNLNSYMSCASCHLDGSHDGRTYDFSEPIGEGLRNTIDLRGRSGIGHGRLHWSGNFDEVHDFESQIRVLGKGSGLLADTIFNQGSYGSALGEPKNGLSSDLDALASYLATLRTVPASPYRQSDGELTSDGQTGRMIFHSLNCNRCHGGADFTDSSFGLRHDVGTIKPSSGRRLGSQLDGIDTPSLKGIWDTAPYFHDGSAATLRDLLTSNSPDSIHHVADQLTSTQLSQLEAYLLQIDESELPASPVENSVNFTAFVSAHDLTGTNADETADPDGDGWPNLAEFVFGGSHPGDAADTPSQRAIFHKETSDTHLQLSWLQRRGGVWKGAHYHWGGYTYRPLASTDLVNWDIQVTHTSTNNSLPQAPAGYQWSTARLHQPTGNLDKAFIRIQVFKE